MLWWILDGFVDFRKEQLHIISNLIQIYKENIRINLQKSEHSKLARKIFFLVISENSKYSKTIFFKLKMWTSQFTFRFTLTNSVNVFVFKSVKILSTLLLLKHVLSKQAPLIRISIFKRPISILQHCFNLLPLNINLLLFKSATFVFLTHSDNF